MFSLAKEQDGEKGNLLARHKAFISYHDSTFLLLLNFTLYKGIFFMRLLVLVLKKLLK